VKDATGHYTAGVLGVALVFLIGTAVLLELGAVWVSRWTPALSTVLVCLPTEALFGPSSTIRQRNING
jgi:hypothetical protein